MACRFGATGFSLEEQIHAELCYCLKVFLGVLGGSQSSFFGVSKLI